MKKDISASGASRNKISKYRYDLLAWEFIDKMAAVMAEGAEHHGENNWKGGFDNQGRDVDNHIHEHGRRYREGDRSEPHLAKMAIGLMFKDYFDNRRQDGIPSDNREASPTFAGDGCTPEGNCDSPEWSEGDSPNIRKYIKTVGQGPTPKSAEELLGERYAIRRDASDSDKTNSGNQRPKPQ